MKEPTVDVVRRRLADGRTIADADVHALVAEIDRLRAALTRLRDCDWTIGRGDRMDPVRDIARAALAGGNA